MRYRTKADLQILGVIPRSPSPDQLNDEEIETLDPDVLRAVLRKQKARRDRETRIKQEQLEAASQEDLTGPFDSQIQRGVKRRRALTIDGEDDGEVFEERAMGERSGPPPEDEVIYISD